MKREIPMKGGDEYDAFTGWRKYYNWRPGILKRIKRQFNKRARQYWKKRVSHESE